MNVPKSSVDKIHYTAIIVVLAMLTAFAPFSTDTYLPSFPAIAKSLNTATPNLQISLSIFFLGLAVGQLFYGPLTERWGRKNPLLAGVAIFVVSSILILFVTNVAWFVILRFIQAIGGCAGMVISRIIIQDLFDQKRSAQALSTMMVIQGIGPVLAPISGGLIVSYFSWEYIFIVLALFGAVCFALTCTYIPETLENSAKRKSSFLQIISEFVYLIRRKAFIIPSIIGSLAVSVMFTFIATSPELFMKVHHLTKTEYGFSFGAIALGIAVFSQINSFLLRRFSPDDILRVAVIFSVFISAFLLFSLFYSSLVMTMLPLFLCVGMVPLIAANSAAIAMSAFPKNAGSASSLIGVMQFGFGFLLSAVPGFFKENNTLVMGVVILLCFSLSMILFLFRVRGASCKI